MRSSILRLGNVVAYYGGELGGACRFTNRPVKMATISSRWLNPSRLASCSRWVAVRSTSGAISDPDRPILFSSAMTSARVRQDSKVDFASAILADTSEPGLADKDF